MLALTAASQLVVEFLLAAFAAVVFIGLLTGRIRTRGLLHGERKGGGRYFSPGRVQLLVVTLFVALNYFVTVLHNRATVSLPDVDPSVLAVLAGSHVVYLSGKARALLFTAFTQGE